MKYIIMADGKGTRWHNYNDMPKHLMKIHGEVVLERIVKQLKKYDKTAEIIITSHNPEYEVKGARRYEPLNNKIELDRFTQELIEDNVCFLYGDTYYSDNTIKQIIESETSDLLFFGNSKSIVAIKVKNAKILQKHIDNVRKLFLEEKIKNCKGWQVYQSFQNLEFDKKQIKDKFIITDEDTQDYNTPKEYENIKNKKEDDKKC